jgi:hypothetical protein
MLATQAMPSDKPLAGLAEYDAVSREPLLAATVGFALMGVLLTVIFGKAQPTVAVRMPVLSAEAHQTAAYARALGPTERLAQHLFDNQLLNLELAGLILTMSVVGAIIIARRRVTTTGAQLVSDEPETAVVSVPGTPINDDPHSIPVLGTDNPRQKAYPET